MVRENQPHEKTLRRRKTENVLANVRFVNIKEAQVILGCSSKDVIKLIHDGVLTGIKTGKSATASFKIVHPGSLFIPYIQAVLARRLEFLPLFSTAEAAEICGVKKVAIRVATHRGYLHAKLSGKRRAYYSLDDLRSYLLSSGRLSGEQDTEWKINRLIQWAKEIIAKEEQEPEPPKNLEELFEQAYRLPPKARDAALEFIYKELEQSKSPASAPDRSA